MTMEATLSETKVARPVYQLEDAFFTLSSSMRSPGAALKGPTQFRALYVVYRFHAQIGQRVDSKVLDSGLTTWPILSNKLRRLCIKILLELFSLLFVPVVVIFIVIYNNVIEIVIVTS